MDRWDHADWLAMFICIISEIGALSHNRPKQLMRLGWNHHYILGTTAFMGYVDLGTHESWAQLSTCAFIVFTFQVTSPVWMISLTVIPHTPSWLSTLTQSDLLVWCYWWSWSNNAHKQLGLRSCQELRTWDRWELTLWTPSNFSLNKIWWSPVMPCTTPHKPTSKMSSLIGNFTHDHSHYRHSCHHLNIWNWRSITL